VEFVKLLIPILALPLILPVVGNEHYGQFVLCQTLVLFFSAFAEFGSNIFTTRLIVRTQHAPKRQLLILRQFLSFKIFLSLLLFAFLCCLPFLINNFDAYLDVYYYSLPMIIAIGITPLFFLQGVENLKSFSLATLLSRVLYLIGILLFVRDTNDTYVISLLNTIVLLSIGVTCLYVTYRQVGCLPIILSIKSFPKIIRMLRSAFIIDFLPNLYNSLATICLGLIVHESVLGIYAFAKRIFEASESLLYVVSRSFYTRLCDSSIYIVKFRKWMIGAAVCSALFPVLFSDLAIQILAGPDFKDAKLFIFALAPCAVLLATVQYFSQINHAAQKFLKSSHWTFAAAFLGVVCLLFLPTLGAYAAVLSLFIARLTLAIGHFKMSRNNVQ
jgi:polysaccharide transporter, PST family